MNILVDMVHPAHVHFFRHAIGELQQRGHNVAVTARAKKDITIELLEGFVISYTTVSTAGQGQLGLLKA